MLERRHSVAAVLAGFALVAVFSAEANAQVSVGFAAGVSHFSVDQEVEIPGVELKFKPGLALGGIVETVLTDKINLQVEPMFLHKGSVAVIEGLGEVDIRASYFEVPVLLEFGLGSGSVQPYVTVGPSFGFLMSATQEAPFIPDEFEDIEDTSESFEMALTAGAGVHFPLGGERTKGFVQGKYYHGLTDTHSEEENHKSRGFKVTFGVTFRLGS